MLYIFGAHQLYIAIFIVVYLHFKTSLRIAIRLETFRLQPALEEFLVILQNHQIKWHTTETSNDHSCSQKRMWLNIQIKNTFK